MERVKSIVIIVLAIAVAVLAFLLHRNRPVGSSEHKLNLDSIVKTRDSLNKELSWKVDSLTFAVQDKDTAIKVLNTRTQAWRKSALEHADAAKSYALLYKNAKADLDTAAMLNHCDDLVVIHAELQYRFREYVAHSDSLLSASFDATVARDSLISVLKQQVSVNEKAVDDLRAGYSKLIIDYQKSEKRRKKGRWLNRIFGFVAGAVTTKLVSK